MLNEFLSNDINAIAAQAGLALAATAFVIHFFFPSRY